MKRVADSRFTLLLGDVRSTSKYIYYTGISLYLWSPDSTLETLMG